MFPAPMRSKSKAKQSKAIAIAQQQEPAITLPNFFVGVIIAVA